MALNNSGLSQANCKANTGEYCTAHCSYPTHSAEFNNVLLTRGLLIRADVAKPEVMRLHTYFTLMTVTNIYTAEVQLVQEAEFYTNWQSLFFKTSTATEP